MADARTTVTPIGGPTALLSYGGLRILTDPTFDEPGDHPRPGSSIVLRKLTGPAVEPEALLVKTLLANAGMARLFWLLAQSGSKRT